MRFVSASVTGSADGSTVLISVAEHLPELGERKRIPGGGNRTYRQVYAASATLAPKPNLISFDGARTQNAAAYALGRVEQHIGLGGVGSVQDPHAGAVDHQIATPECRRRPGSRQYRCRACPRPRPAGSPSAWRLAGRPAGGCHIVAATVLQFADRGLRPVVHHPVRVLAIARFSA